MNYYYTDSQNKTAGPVSRDALQTLIKNGNLKSDPLVIPEGGSEWRPLSAYGKVEGAAAPLGGSPGAAPASAAQSGGQFCSKCGTRLPANATFCSSCGTAVSGGGGGGNQASAAADMVKAASKDALAAFKMFATNPVGGLAGAFDNLGPSRGLSVGVTFSAVFAICTMLLIYRATSNLGMFAIPHNFGFFMRALVISITPVAALFGSCVAVRMILKGQGAFGQDSFISGASMLPLGVVALLAALIGVGNTQVIGFVSIFGICLLILMLFAGLTRIYKISEQAATISVPLMLIVTGFVCKIVGQQMLQSFMQSMMQMPMPMMPMQ